MGIELPPELAEAAARTGVRWPEADEDAMREQAGAWREAARSLEGLAGDADAVAGKALTAMSGPASDSARRSWSGFVEPDSGTLTSASRDATAAADRLEDAAGRVGDAKVELVRQLVDAQQHTDAANAAAGVGHASALAGLETTLHGAAANVHDVTGGLVESVGPGSAQGQAGSGPQGHETAEGAHPGAHTAGGQSGLLSAATGIPASVVDGAMSTVDGQGSGDGVVDGLLGTVHDTVGAAGGAVHDTVGHTVGAVDDAVRPVSGDAGLGTAPGATEPPGHAAAPEGPGHGGPFTPPGQHFPQGQPLPFGPGSPHAGTGPIAMPDAPTPPRGGAFSPVAGVDPNVHVGYPAHGADAPTPPNGTPMPAHGSTQLSGFAPGPSAAGAPPAAALPPQPMAPPAAPQGPAYGGAPFAGGQQFAPQPFAGQGWGPGAPAQYGGGQPPHAPPPPSGVPGGVAGAPQRPAPQQPPQRWGMPPAQQPQQAPPAQPVQQQPPQQYSQQGRPPEPVRPQPPASAVPLGSPRQERESIVALFVVHMFPIGHLPVATGRPARQLPVPDPEQETGEAPAVPRFPPHDHPESSVVDPGHALAWLRNGWRQPSAPPASVLPGPPPELTEGHDPLGELHEREWDERFLVRDGDRPEYAWPSGEGHPEGGCEPGEPVLLAEGVELDRFGTASGRVFSADGTPFAKRSLPPGHLDAGYRRYRVLREVPMWKADSVGWFAQPGGGVRYRSVYGAAELVTLGYLADITFEERS